MKQIIISIVGALLVLQAVKLIIPESTVKKYASFIVSATVMLILTAAVFGSSFSCFPEFDETEAESYSDSFEDLRQSQIEREFSRQLIGDMKKSIPELKNSELSFSFNISEDNTGYVSHMLIKSPDAEDSAVKTRVSEMYMIPVEDIEWRKV
ncbi:MAG: hypothetical protein SPL89_06470 [Clostridia bacterium]|nr:hypothetical protein [Clostridia bacterium]